MYIFSFRVLVFPCLSSYDLTLVAFALECVFIGSNSIFYFVGNFKLLYYCTVMTLPHPLTGSTLLPSWPARPLCGLRPNVLGRPTALFFMALYARVFITCLTGLHVLAMICAVLVDAMTLHLVDGLIAFLVYN